MISQDGYIVMFAAGVALGASFMAGWLWFFVTLGVVGGVPLALFLWAAYRDWRFHRRYRG